MQAKLWLFALLLTSSVRLQAVVVPNIVVYFDGNNFTVKTNADEDVAITKTDTSITIVPTL